MSNYPKVYGHCDAGCKQRVVPYEEYLTSATFIAENTDSEGKFVLEQGKTYKISNSNDTDSWGFNIQVVPLMKKGNYTSTPITWYLTLPVYDKYDNYIKFRWLELILEPVSGTDYTIKLVCEVNGVRQTVSYGSSTVSLYGYDISTLNTEVRVYNATNCWIFNEDAEIVGGGNGEGGFTETDPTVPSWAKGSEKPTYTADEVGADKSGTALSVVSAHNVEETSHNDIRLLIEGLTSRLNALANSDDTTLDQMAEVVAYIKDNRELFEQITTGKVNVADIVNNLTTNVATKPLSAAQGVALKALIDAITVPTKLSELTNDSGYLTSIPIVQSTGDSETEVMSQKAVTDEISRVDILKKDTTAWSPVNILEDVTWGTKGTIWGSSGTTPASKEDYTAATELTLAVPGATYKTERFVGQIRFYDANKKHGDVQVSYAAATVLEFTVPDDVAYFGISYQSSALTNQADVVKQKIWRTTMSDAEYNALPARNDSLKALYGKTIVGFGDSIFGYVRDDSSVLSNVANVTGATVYNVGFGGCRMAARHNAGYAAFAMYKLADAVTSGVWTDQDNEAPSGSSYFPEQLALLKSIDFNDVDIVIIHYGSNDFTAGNGVAIDNMDNQYDCNTFIGAFRYSIEKLLTAYPHLQIYVSLPTYCKYSTGEAFPENHTNTLGKYVHEYVDALRNAATEYNLSVIDGFYGLGINKFNVDTLTIDGAHHNDKGRKRLGEFIAGYLIGNQTSGKSGIDINAVNSLINTAIGDAIGGSY